MLQTNLHCFSVVAYYVVSYYRGLFGRRLHIPAVNSNIGTEACGEL
jgi:hypothetical protein